MHDSGAFAGWFPAAMTNAILPETAVRAIIQTDDIALWRGADGVARAWENRCPHRGMRLSYGVVRGNRLTCLYHGWSYDGGGGCAAIPAHPDVTPPKTIRVRTYQCREIGWIGLGCTGSRRHACPYDRRGLGALPIVAYRAARGFERCIGANPGCRGGTISRAGCQSSDALQRVGSSRRSADGGTGGDAALHGSWHDPKRRRATMSANGSGLSD